MKTAEVRRVLRARHTAAPNDIGPAWVVLEEAFRIDLMALACHAQRRAEPRYPWVGYEIKVSRADFLNEMKSPAKRAFGVEITNEFYFVCPAGLIKPEEVPGDCGLMYVWPTRTQIQKGSPITEARPLSHYQLAIMMRHGINPGWLRAMSLKRQSLRWQEKEVERERKELEEERSRMHALLADKLAHLVEPGQRWRSLRRRPLGSHDEYTVLEVTERTVRLSDGIERSFEWFPRVALGEFLLNYEPA